MTNNRVVFSRILVILGSLILFIGATGLIDINSKIADIDQKGKSRYLEKKSPPFADLNIIKSSIVSKESKIAISDPFFSIQADSPLELKPFQFFVHTENHILENPKIPDKIVIPSINLMAPVVISDFNTTKIEGETFGQWVAPSKFAAGWQPDSALIGESGNIVINGHHNEYGEVFGNLVDVNVGDIIIVYSGNSKMEFVVSNRMILAERFQPAEVRLDNARWLARTDDVRLTLVTCWPKESNTHRLIIVARPISH